MTAAFGTGLSPSILLWRKAPCPRIPAHIAAFQIQIPGERRK